MRGVVINRQETDTVLLNYTSPICPKISPALHVAKNNFLLPGSGNSLLIKPGTPGDSHFNVRATTWDGDGCEAVS